jgi:hypothetical protein
MRMPIVTEITRRLDPVDHDPFVDDLRVVDERGIRPADRLKSARPRE